VIFSTAWADGPAGRGSKTESSAPSRTGGSHRWLVSTEHVHFPMKLVHADRHAKGLTGLSGSRVGLTLLGNEQQHLLGN
jgi:hypothetical protein